MSPHRKIPRDGVSSRGRASSRAGAPKGFGDRGADASCGHMGIPTAKPVQSFRFEIILAFFALAALIFFGRLFYVQIIMADAYSAMAEETRTISFTTTPRRGTIYDRNGTVLAISVDATTIYVNPAEVTDADYEAEKLAEVLGGDVETYKAKLQQTGTFVYIRRQADVEVAKQVKELDLDGIYFIADTRREYPNGRIGGQIIGFCDVDGNGITGLELYYDDILKGTPGTYSAERGELGMPIPGGVHEDTPAIDGQDIMISIDIELQDKLERSLEEGTAYISAEGGSAVVMDAATGEIYAAASLDYLDPSDLSSIIPGSDQLKAVTQAFEPGSIFKTVSALAILESNSMEPEDELFCPAEIEADGYKVSDAHERDDATFTLRQIMDQSSNVGISLATENMGFDIFYNKILQYNLNEPTGVDYPGEAGGYMPDFGHWARIMGYNISFGQGVSVTPLQMVRFYGMLLNEGVQVTPHFLVGLPQTGEIPEYETEVVTTDQAAMDKMVDMLTSVVESGTGKGAAIYGYTVAGKTSTAEIAEGGGYKEGVYNLCFTGFITNSNSHLVCFVGANEVPDDGSVGFIFKDIMSYAIDRFNIASE